MGVESAREFMGFQTGFLSHLRVGHARVIRYFATNAARTKPFHELVRLYDIVYRLLRQRNCHSEQRTAFVQCFVAIFCFYAHLPFAFHRVAAVLKVGAMTCKQHSQGVGERVQSFLITHCCFRLCLPLCR